MGEGLDLKAFLAEQASEGKVDSHGSFTVAREKALKKLAHFALPEPYDWVLKIVQAANLWRVPKLVIRQTRIATSFYFRPSPGEQFPSESAIITALESPVLDQGNPVHAIAMALRSLVEQARLSFVLAVRQHGEMCKPIFAGDDVSGLAPATREAWTNLRSEGVRLTVSHFQGSESLTGRYLPTFSRQQRRDVEIRRKMEERCFASAVPIDLDGRPLGVVFPRGDYFQTHRLRPLLLGRFPEGDRTLQGVEAVQVVSGRLPRNHLRVSTSPERPGQAWFLISGPDWRVESLTYRRLSSLLTPLDRETAEATSSHYVWWTRQGVVVARYRIQGQGHPDASLQLILPSDHLRTDLSGLKVDMPRGWGVTDDARAALGAINRELDLLLQGEKARATLLAAPESGSEEAPSAKDSAVLEPEAESLEGAEASTFSDSLLPSSASPGLGMLYALGSAAEMLSSLPFHDGRLDRWADRVMALLGEVRQDLGRVIAD